MAKPVILAVDDDPQVLAAVQRDLRGKYRTDYRIVGAESGAAALEVVHELKRRDEPIALFLVDQRMPQMEGTDFLREALLLFPSARKVLLTAYADTEAAIASINEVGLDHYLMKPWQPPEQKLYPVLDDLLDDWMATAPPTFEGIRVVGVRWSPLSHEVKDFLSRNQIPYQWLDVEADESARAMVEALTPAGEDSPELPVVFLQDGDYLIRPDARELAARVGLSTTAKADYYDLVIVGAGPAGLGAAVYGASEGLSVAMIEREAAGGQAGTSSRIENYLGFPKGISGSDLARRATAQAKRFGAEILAAAEATHVRVEDPYRVVELSDGTELSCKALIVATGMTLRRVEAPGFEEFRAAGVYYGAATTEAAEYKGEHVFVVGGANSAGQGAMLFSQYAKQVTILVRGSSLADRMSRYLIDQIEATENIEVLTGTEVVEVSGEGHVESITIANRESGEKSTIPAAAVFVFVGAVPHSDLVAGIVERDEAGFILTGSDLVREGRRPRGWKLKRDPYLLETSVPGIFAAGDIQRGAVRRVASAVGQGAIAVTFVHQYLQEV